MTAQTTQTTQKVISLNIGYCGYATGDFCHGKSGEKIFCCVEHRDEYLTRERKTELEKSLIKYILR